MNKTEKRMKIFMLIMQVIIQAVLLFPWMNMGTWKCNVPGYLIKIGCFGRWDELHKEKSEAFGSTGRCR